MYPLVHSPKGHNSQSQTVQSQELLEMWMRAQALPSSAALPGHDQEAGSEATRLGHKPLSPTRWQHHRQQVNLLCHSDPSCGFFGFIPFSSKQKPWAGRRVGIEVGGVELQWAQTHAGGALQVPGPSACCPPTCLLLLLLGSELEAFQKPTGGQATHPWPSDSGCQ